MGMRSSEQDLAGLKAELLFQRGAGTLVNRLRNTKRVAGEDNCAITIRVFEGENLDPKVHCFADGWICAARVAGQPERFVWRDIGLSQTRLPQRFRSH